MEFSYCLIMIDLNSLEKNFNLIETNIKSSKLTKKQKDGINKKLDNIYVSFKGKNLKTIKKSEYDSFLQKINSIKKFLKYPIIKTKREIDAFLNAIKSSTEIEEIMRAFLKKYEGKTEILYKDIKDLM
ncbi:unnamed protein product, partial [marine sediment metagenome]